MKIIASILLLFSLVTCSCVAGERYETTCTHVTITTREETRKEQFERIRKNNLVFEEEVGKPRHEIKEESKCDFKTQVDIGGPMSSTLITGFCKKCNKMTYLSYDRGGVAPPCEGVWDPATGKKRYIYKCEDCGEPFFSITINSYENNFIYCPKCGNMSLKHTLKKRYD